MKKIPLLQGSLEWLEYRYTRLMATCTSSILGINPFKTPLDLFLEKTKRTEPTPMNLKMQRGHDLEDEARKLFIEITGINMTPCVVESEQYYFMAASLDGLSDDEKYVLEVKCPNKDTHELAILGEIKPYYYAQIHKQLFVTGARKCYYFSYNPDFDGRKSTIIEILPNYEYIKHMVEEEKKFYFEYLMKDVEPPKEWTFTPKESREW